MHKESAMFEKLLIEHCSPTLASLKTANLFAVFYSSEEELESQITYWNRELERKGVSILLMKKKPGWALLYVCRFGSLQKKLRDPEVAEFLTEYGYEIDDGEINVRKALERLKLRLNNEDYFPHEIGIFLDYPVGDVRCFIRNAGHHYKCKGCWKVYCNECETVKLFAKFDKCNKVYRQLWNSGFPIQRLTVAV